MNLTDLVRMNLALTVAMAVVLVAAIVGIARRLGRVDQSLRSVQTSIERHAEADALALSRIEGRLDLALQGREVAIEAERTALAAKSEATKAGKVAMEAHATIHDLRDWRDP
jgi:hypothetical protein